MRYIGSKNRILPFIDEVISNTYGDIKNAIVADLFAGTACVAEMFKHKGAHVISNDYMRFSYAIQVAKIKINSIPSCRMDYEEAISRLNSVDSKKGFFYNEYTIEGTKNKDFSRNYFSPENAAKIDGICIQMKEWLSSKEINYSMYYLLAASLVDAITKVSNTSGTYGAFLKIDDNRKFKELVLEPWKITSNGKNNKCFCRDIDYIINHVSGDILYLDPPYNSRQYPPYYHILETAVLYDNPDIYGITGRRHYGDKLSKFCQKLNAENALKDIVFKANFKHIYISYSTDGIINVESLTQALKESGQFESVKCYNTEYRRYKSNDGGSHSNKLKELIIYGKKR